MTQRQASGPAPASDNRFRIPVTQVERAVPSCRTPPTSAARDRPDGGLDLVLSIVLLAGRLGLGIAAVVRTGATGLGGARSGDTRPW